VLDLTRVSAPSPLLIESLRPLRRHEYDRLVELGAFDDERLELLAGVLVTMSPQGAEHVEVTACLMERLVLALAGRARVRPQLPLSLSDHSEPEPDLAVVQLGDYSHVHPASALLIVEVADASLRMDRDLKAELYAAAGIPEYWLVDLVGRVVHVYRAAVGRRYTEVSSHAPGATLRPTAFPDVTIAVRSLIRTR